MLRNIDSKNFIFRLADYLFGLAEFVFALANFCFVSQSSSKLFFKLLWFFDEIEINSFPLVLTLIPQLWNRSRRIGALERSDKWYLFSLTNVSSAPKFPVKQSILDEVVAVNGGRLIQVKINESSGVAGANWYRYDINFSFLMAANFNCMQVN
ncbi:hypothetical protein DY000_02033024 [Brassica cretica]|uniref:Uncharacterized protein n=1 Tax=Brassica cretica TaxID=69181 RepID=A0ABQ7DR36_BRACR|nr:hypothetical protein DY000_02033024 [Brassica cretica]